MGNAGAETVRAVGIGAQIVDLNHASTRDNRFVRLATIFLIITMGYCLHVLSVLREPTAEFAYPCLPPAYPAVTQTERMAGHHGETDQANSGKDRCGRPRRVLMG